MALYTSNINVCFPVSVNISETGEKQITFSRVETGTGDYCCDVPKFRAKTFTRLRKETSEDSVQKLNLPFSYRAYENV